MHWEMEPGSVLNSSSARFMSQYRAFRKHGSGVGCSLPVFMKKMGPGRVAERRQGKGAG